ncbi:MAG: hypothetical protein PVG83_04680 [Acidimicrobiia bacterium]|jgi:hypothetical protein
MSKRARLVVGLAIAVLAAALLLLDLIESGWAVAIGMVGIGTIASSARARPD